MFFDTAIYNLMPFGISIMTEVIHKDDFSNDYLGWIENHGKFKVGERFGALSWGNDLELADWSRNGYLFRRYLEKCQSGDMFRAFLAFNY